MKVRFRDEFLVITGMGAAILSFISSSLMSRVVFCACLGLMILNKLDKTRDNERKY